MTPEDFAWRLAKASPVWVAVILACEHCGARHYTVRQATSAKAAGPCPLGCGGEERPVATLGKPSTFEVAAREITIHTPDGARKPDADGLAK